MGEGGKAGLLQVFPYFFFDSRWIPVVMEPESINESGHMGVDNNPRRAETAGNDQIGGFPAYPGKGEQLLHFRGHLSAVLRHDFPGAQHQVSGLGMEKPDRSNKALHILHVGQSHGPGVRIGGEKGGGHRVDLIVGALGAQNHRTEKLETAR
ncbi:hypothetical protein SDC9_04602 [bioreactor metagenome]|uniref:Uncharacterized protein n=1 Tax=bioreactor metagenome TaxID=1076179 RepID=A0A644SWQ3_9ZZZZ